MKKVLQAALEALKKQLSRLKNLLMSKVTTSERLWSEEVGIADADSDWCGEPGYEFGNGRRFRTPKPPHHPPTHPPKKGIDVSVSTRQSLATTAKAEAAFEGALITAAQAQMVAAAVVVSIGVGVATGQGERSSADLVTRDAGAVEAMIQQAQQSIGVVGVSSAAAVNAQQVGRVDGRLVALSLGAADAALGQAQRSAAVATVSALLVGDTKQAQRSVAIAGAASDATVATRQAASVGAQARALSVGVIEGATRQAQRSASVAAVFTNMTGGTKQGERTAIAAAVASTVVTTTRQAQRMTAALASTTASGTITAASGALADVQAAVNNASDGYTVMIPAGTFDWGASGQLNVPGGIYLKGAGKTATIIKRNGKPSSESVRLIKFDGSNGKRSRISHLQAVGNNVNGIDDYGIGFHNGCLDFMMHDCLVRNFAFCGVYVGESQRQRGVIFKCDIVDNYVAGRGNLGYGVAVFGGSNYPALELGTQNAVFIEDCVMSGNRHNVASNNGSFYVSRYNDINCVSLTKDWAMMDAHGLSSSPRGSRGYEIYNNTFRATLSSGRVRTAVGIRGGDGVIFNNTVSADYARAFELEIEGFNSTDPYPGQDQIRSLYIWGNTSSTSYPNGIDVAADATNHVKLGRDYFITARPGYTPYTYPHPLRS